MIQSKEQLQSEMTVLRACYDARSWVRAQRVVTAIGVLALCDRIDWFCWLAEKRGKLDLLKEFMTYASGRADYHASKCPNIYDVGRYADYSRRDLNEKNAYWGTAETCAYWATRAYEARYDDNRQARSKARAALVQWWVSRAEQLLS